MATAIARSYGAVQDFQFGELDFTWRLAVTVRALYDCHCRLLCYCTGIDAPGQTWPFVAIVGIGLAQIQEKAAFFVFKEETRV